jgi:nucleoside-diphosphate-sugar epimerase
MADGKGALENMAVSEGFWDYRPVLVTGASGPVGGWLVDRLLDAGAGIAGRNPISTFESNVRGTWSLLEACRRSPTVKQVVVASSDKAHGAQESLPYDETLPLRRWPERRSISPTKPRRRTWRWFRPSCGS